ncbi:MULTISPECIES: hypothetical protein [Fusobacterium]|uniref:Uncharacterized protein n=2 Tax=Fusobacterium TaxID=848 RepID=A0A2D3PPN5_9FUSO|nr:MULTISPECIES: hypothetical protein [Fusobacterium]ATV69665.1 hypothetical protein CTM98_02800 [Fusobacterium pseudoperiodonticum]PHI11913.1 hypothetical protein CBG56_08845 [Fusobacterium polymorphum]
MNDKEKNIIKNIFSEGKIKKCLFCGIKNNIADCHTIQENNYLNRILDNGLIYTFNYDNKGKKLEFKVTHKGKSEFGIFNGFCKEHDTKLFYQLKMVGNSLKQKNNYFYLLLEVFAIAFIKKEN